MIRRLGAISVAGGLICVASACLPASARAVINANALMPSVTSSACGSGISAITYTPAQGFNPNTATDSELQANDFPPRPTNARAFATWKHYVNSPVRRKTSCSDLSPSSDSVGPASIAGPATVKGAVPDTPANVPCNSQLISGHWTKCVSWAGNVAVDKNYSGIQATWTIPAARTSAPTGLYSYSVDWVGLNLGANDLPLLQAGSESDGDGVESTYLLWFEAYSNLPKQNVENVSPGDVLYTHVTATSSQSYYHLDDETSGYNKTFSWAHALQFDGTAGWILERQSINGGLNYLANAPMRFTDAKASGSGFGLTGVGSLPHAAVEMTTCDGTVLMAKPGPISSDGLNFSEAFYNSGGGIHDTGGC